MQEMPNENKQYVALPAMFLSGDRWEFWVRTGNREISVLLQQQVLQTFEEKLQRKWGISYMSRFSC